MTLADELHAWLEENWDPDHSVREWWERLGNAGWAAPTLPTNAYGKGLSRSDAVAVQGEIAAFGALGAPGGLGLMLAAPTIAAHGTQDQIDRYIHPIVTGIDGWCQLFSEPGAGSDLAGLTTRAVKDGDEWIVNGQKVWTSLGQFADKAMLIARTDPDAPKHQGITWFVFDMHQSGVEVRPLKEMTGHAMFNEVFVTDAHVGEEAIIGGLHNGWAVANSTLMFERSGLGAGGGSAAASVVVPGSVGGQLDLRAGDFVRAPKKPRAGEPAASKEPVSRGGGVLGTGAAQFIDQARRNGRIADHTIRQDLVRLHTMGEIARFNNLRMKASKHAGKDIPGMANLAKLSMSDMMRLSRDLGLRIAGASGMLHSYDEAGRGVLEQVIDDPHLETVTRIALWAQAPSIYGGTDQVQRNIIGERVLGLAKEPGNEKTQPFSSLPKNA